MEHAPFLRAIRDQPLEDAPRMIYADWLQEYDHPVRAELIRLQCNLAHEEDAQIYQHLKHRELNCLHHLRNSRIPHPELSGIEWLPPHRGIFQSFRCDPTQTTQDAFVAALDHAWEWVLFTRKSSRRSYRSEDGALFLRQLRDVSRIWSLFVEPDDTPLPAWRTSDVMALLAGNTHLKNLRELYVPIRASNRFVVTDLSKLRTLTLFADTQGAPNDYRSLSLLASPHLGEVDVLDLTGCNFTTKALKAFVDAPLFQGLRALGLAHGKFGKDGVELLGAQPDLEYLDLRGIPLKEHQAAALLDPAAFPKLRRVALSKKHLSKQFRHQLVDRYGNDHRLVPWPQRRRRYAVTDTSQYWGRVIRGRLQNAVPAT